METAPPETAVSPAYIPTFRIEVSPRLEASGANGRSYVQAAHQLGFTALDHCRAIRLYFIQGRLSYDEACYLGRQLLADPVAEEVEIQKWPPQPSPASSSPSPSPHAIEVTLLPGVTDPPADNLVRAAHLLGIEGVQRAATGQRYLLQGDLGDATLQQLASELFANPVIQRFTVNRPITPPFFPYQQADDTVETIAVRTADDKILQQISATRRLALNLAEMQAIRAYYQQEEREPTDVELETLAQTWSEHCVHKTFKAVIEYSGPQPGAGADAPPVSQTIDGLLKTYIRGATEKIDKPWVQSAFVDNAGIIAFDDRFDLAFKVETHNHPSALEPFGGANTGVGGVVRDVLGVSARPIANTDILCFGPPDLPHEALPAGVLHPRRIAAGVIDGIEDYGNKMGIPTVNGAIFYHPGYIANPLVYCGCLGILPRDSHPTAAQPGDLIVAIGGRTGRDGLRGATFSSMEMDVETSEIAGTAVQIGNPIQEKQVQEVVLRARDERLYNAVTDCGAGGFSSAVGEMGEKLGATVQLKNVTLKYPGLRPWEIWLSEAQERMVLAVSQDKWPRLQEICAGQDVEAIVLGEFEASGRLRLYYGERLVGDLAMDFLYGGLPPRRMKAAWRPANEAETQAAESAPPDWDKVLLALLAHPTIRSKEDVVRRYDHEVQAGTAVKPLVGTADHGPGDATVLVPLDTQSTTSETPPMIRAAALANGICPLYGELDPYAMAWAAIDEALRNVVAAGADPDQVAILDNFCWGNPNLPDRLGALVRCAQGCHDAALAYQTPFISGKDSLNNEYTGADGRKHAIPGTLLISALGIVPDVQKTASMDLKQAGNFLMVVGETRAELGGSHYGLVSGPIRDHHRVVPQPVGDARRRLRALHRVIGAGLVQSCHDCSEGGLAVALAEMCLAGGLGAEVQLQYAPRDPRAAHAPDAAILFSESLCRFIVEVHPDDVGEFEKVMANVPHACCGVTGGETLRVNGRHDTTLLSLPVTALQQAWRGHLDLPPVADQRPSTLPAPSPSSALPALSSTPRVLILHANGTNRDRDAALACRLAGGAPEIVHVNQLLAAERRLADYHMLVIPGGFSYGDDLGGGVLWALDLRYRLQEEMARFVASGRPVLGICNGFQALVKAGLLPGKESAIEGLYVEEKRPVTLTYNRRAHFECRWTYLRPHSHTPSLFLQGMEELIYCPVAHGEGRLAARDEAVVAALRDNHLIALTYCDANGETAAYPANPNGSVGNIAGLCNAAGNVLGLMPHPEDHIFPWQHPRRHRGQRGMMGLRLFANGLKRS